MIKSKLESALQYTDGLVKIQGERANAFKEIAVEIGCRNR